MASGARTVGLAGLLDGKVHGAAVSRPKQPSRQVGWRQTGAAVR
jgi:hypothetical protein